MKKFLTITYWSIFLFYFALLVDTVFITRDARRSINLIPFQMINEHGFSLNVWGNIVTFIPLGIYIALQLKNFTFKKALVFIVGASLTIEIIQLTFARGATDIDDVILNTIGGFIGILIYRLFKKLFKTREKVQNAISILSFVIGVSMILLVVVLIISN